jgi:hypothetical protein
VEAVLVLLLDAVDPAQKQMKPQMLDERQAC